MLTRMGTGGPPTPSSSIAVLEAVDAVGDAAERRADLALAVGQQLVHAAAHVSAP